MKNWIRFERNGEAKTGSVISSGRKLLIADDGEMIEMDSVKLLPIAKPSKIIGIGANYPNPQMKEPVFKFFFKPPSGLAAQGDAIVRPLSADTVIVEPELAIIIGRQAKDVNIAEASEFIAGYTLANDAAVLEQAAADLALAKCYDTFTPAGPWAVEAFDRANKSITLSVNGEEKVRGNLSDMIFSPEEIIVRLSKVMTLEKGDLILTGTPCYYSQLNAGDVVSVHVPGIGRLDNHIV